MSILTAISRGCKGTLSDGTVRYTIDFEPRYAIAAAELFAMPGTEMGVVALKDGRAPNGDLSDESMSTSNSGAALQSRADHNEDVLDMVASPNHPAFPVANDNHKTKHITLANYAGMFCADPKFWEWLQIARGKKITNSDEAADYLRRECNVMSRAVIDRDKYASDTFRQIMHNFDKWKGAQK